MNIYEMEKDEDLVESLLEMVEKNTGKKIFTMKVLDQVDEGLDVIIAFEDKSILKGLISTQEIDGRMACRVRGNYL